MAIRYSAILLNIIMYLSVYPAVYVCTFSTHAHAAQEIDILAQDVNGDVEVMSPLTYQWAPVKDGDTIPEGSLIRTGPYSNMTLAFAESSVAIVDSYAYIEIEKFSRTAEAVNTKLNVHVGSVVSILNESAPRKNNYEIVTPAYNDKLRGNGISRIAAGAMYGDTLKTVDKLQIEGGQIISGEDIVATIIYGKDVIADEGEYVMADGGLQVMHYNSRDIQQSLLDTFENNNLRESIYTPEIRDNYQNTFRPGQEALQNQTYGESSSFEPDEKLILKSTIKEPTKITTSFGSVYGFGSMDSFISTQPSESVLIDNVIPLLEHE